MHLFIGGHLVASTFWLFLSTWVYKYLFEILLPMPLVIYSEAKLLYPMAIQFWNFWRTVICFFIVALLFNMPTDSAKGVPFLHILITCHFLIFVLFYFSIIASFIGMSWHLLVVLIFISLIISDVQYLFTCLLATYNKSLEECLSKSFAHFLLLLLLSYMSSLCILMQLVNMRILAFERKLFRELNTYCFYLL